MKKIFFGGGGWGANKVHYGRCASGELFSCAEMRNLRSRSEPKGSGSILLSPILCFIKRCYDKEEFDTDRS